ncbi:hypothetical protein CEXT_810951 [Caerostris extrusa]|uniref:Secreted protein n=1 Tax=Caerostris extrusa TaxID=172846 RepID=A0AAV4PDD2_CAEEX|nr:hypothetical protein CEXT_810951 [Caerostris extrusa]
MWQHSASHRCVWHAATLSVWLSSTLSLFVETLNHGEVYVSEYFIHLFSAKRPEQRKRKVFDEEKKIFGSQCFLCEAQGTHQVYLFRTRCASIPHSPFLHPSLC